MQKHTIKTLQDTKRLAQQIARQLRGGETIGLIGNLGAGKTTFIQYLAKALGVKQTVNSPTFNIIKVYPIMSLRGVPMQSGRRGNPVINEIASSRILGTRNDKKNIKQLVHIDAYRLKSAQELEALGVEEYLDNPETVTVIEWADKVKELLPKDAMIINIKVKSEKERVFEINPAP